METSKKRLSSKTAVGLGLALSLGFLLAGPALAGAPAEAQQSAKRSDLTIESDVLKALASYPDIGSEQITARTEDGVVTLEGSASSETARGQAQVVAAGVDGVRSVVNRVKVNGVPAAKPSAEIPLPQQEPEQPQPAERRQPVERREPIEQRQPAEEEPVQQAQSTAPSDPQPPPRATQPGANGNWGQAGPPPDVQNGQVPPPQETSPQPQPPQTAQQNDPYPIQDPGQDDAPPSSAPRETYPQPPNAQRAPNPPRRGYPQQRANSYPPRLAASPLTVPAATLLSVRTSEPLDSRRLRGGEPFQAIVARDIYEGEYLAIPRGAVLEGRVIGVKRPGAFSGGAGFALQIMALNLGGQSYPVATDTFASDTTGKGGYTTANTLGGAAIGAIIGGIAGRGPGAAIGAAAGGVTGAGVSAATAGPREVMPAETLLAFHLRAPLTINPISYAEAQRLESSVPPQQPRPVRRPPPYPYAYGYPPPPPYYYRRYYYPYPYRYYWR